MPETLSTNIQDYLKHIYELTASGVKASTNKLAEKLGISAASVTNMLQKLAKIEPPYVIYQKYQGVHLTQSGRVAALKIIRRHLLVELYLIETLGYGWHEAHQEAEILEHVVSPLLESRIDAALGYPKFSPHGDPIPDSNLAIPQQEHILLSGLEVGETALILRVPHEDPQILEYLEKSGIIPGFHIKLLSCAPHDQTLRIQVVETGEKVVIGPSLSKEIALSVTD
ncbi:MAG TPA: metal-dependent transcriptional regulator [Brevefilum fermentans]|jgi:DtxR family Mn-dependent transcriptional regulator|uniref:Manganese transport regulator n=1 Tax=Candidatus Brevifilum fermentans TaxID=1986204 RepID=A0A1Y6K6P6_9CHLR|nr:metal-dependent transcriptional regulator [Brevefilum fermentans]MDI9565268.1 metal-dependent transcriptional regulator [Chloroflexota bacterium]OQB84487.1 MAG: Iron-dependent repressor IdeR [Chloroflexi bacterium ADurb.Bin120]SMX53720.1 putative DtxR family transcriptional regulator [Brevefilum fermentans]HOM67762.1 metal-dependent transcriptional regulator [Brevefilum fermentans]HQA29283.1 metal-dependent transcriptional regulator [Brevefilum fermentans]